MENERKTVQFQGKITPGLSAKLQEKEELLRTKGIVNDKNDFIEMMFETFEKADLTEGSTEKKQVLKDVEDLTKSINTAFLNLLRKSEAESVKLRNKYEHEAEMLDNAKTKVEETLSELKEKNSELQEQNASLKKEVADLRNQYNKLSEKSDSDSKHLRNYLAQIEKLQNEIEQNKELIELNQELKTKVEKLATEVKEKTNENAALQQQHKAELHERRVENDNAWSERLEKVKEELHAERSNSLSLKAEINDLTSKVKELNHSASTKDNKIEELSGSIATKDAQIEKLKIEIANFKKEKKAKE